jgi:hypothetical protein
VPDDIADPPPQNNHSDNRLPWVRAWRRHGWTHLHPIIPRLAGDTRQWAQGKAPGRMDHRGNWWPLNVQAPGVHGEIEDVNQQLNHECRRAWAHGAGIGVLGRIIPAIDVDLKDPLETRALRDMLSQVFGAACFLRVGASPKFLMPFRMGDDVIDLRKMVLAVRPETGEQIEVLAGGQQWVLDGTHGGTGRPYEWLPSPWRPCPCPYPLTPGPGTGTPCPLTPGGGATGRLRPAVTDLPVLGLDALESLLRGMASVLGLARRVKIKVEHELPLRPARELAGPEALCVEVLRAWPNGREVGRDVYVRVAHALAGASRRDTDWAGSVLFSRWARRHPKADPDHDARVWRSVKQPRLGVEWLIGRVPEGPGVTAGQRANWLIELLGWRETRDNETQTGRE